MKSILKSIGYIFIYFLFQIIINIIFSLIAVKNEAYTEIEIAEYITNNILLITIISNFITLILFAICRKVSKTPKQKLIVFQKRAWTEYLICSVVTFAASMCFTLLTYNIQFDNAQLISRSTAYYSQKSPIVGLGVMVLALLVSAPIVEEYICRGILFSELQKKFSPITTIILCCAKFGVMHIFAGGFLLALGSTLMGILVGYF